MSDLQRQLAQNFASAFDRYEEHMRNANPLSAEDLMAVTPLTMELLTGQWAASLEIKTKHDLMRSGIDSIR